MKREIKILLCLVLIGFTVNIYADIPIVSHRYLADPGSLVYNGRVYLYCSNDDENPVEGGYEMSSIVCVSSSDLKNWTDHGIVFDVPRDASWTTKSWAPSVVERDGKFYLYFGNGGSAIGVARADSPLGPFLDPNGTSIVNSNTPGVLPAEGIWIFDPMTFVDDDGQAYMYFGGNGEDNMRIIKLNDDMISVDGAATRFTVPYFFEAAWMHKHNEIYYFTYSTNPGNGMRIDYMTSDNAITGFTYGGVVSEQPPDNNNNNHQAIFKMNGHWYQAYHNRIVASQAGIPTGYRRNLCLDSIYHNTDGSIEVMVNTEDGVKQVGYLDPFTRVEAETMNAQNGIKTEACGEEGMNVTSIEDGDWIKVYGVDFGSMGAAAFTTSLASEVKYGSTIGDSIEIRLDDVNGTRIGTVPVTYTGGLDVWKSGTVAIEEVSGVHDVYFVFTGGNDENLFNFDYWYFTEKTVEHDLLAINATVDKYKIDVGYDSAFISVTAIYTDGTTEIITSLTSFTFDKENVIQIEQDSLIRGHYYDTVTVTAHYNEHTDSVKIIVKDLEGELTVTQLHAESEIAIFTGGSTEIEILAEFEDGHVEDVTNTATYDNPNPEIATISNGVISGVSEGEVDITASFQGELGEAKSTTIQVTVTTGAGIWLEAECGTVGSLWDIPIDDNASNDSYVTIQSGNNSTDGPPTDPSGHLTFTFNISVSGTYFLYFRVSCPNADGDSYWIKMDDGQFNMWNNIQSSFSWIWTNFDTEYDLNAGTHTLTIAYREDDAKLDKILLTNSGGDLSGEGSEAENLCEITEVKYEHAARTEIFPNPVSEELTISLPNSSADISIYNIDGKNVFVQRANSMELAVNMANYSPGIYFVKISSQEQTIVRKIIKN